VPPSSVMNSRRLMGFPSCRDSGRAKAITFGANGGPREHAAWAVAPTTRSPPLASAAITAPAAPSSNLLLAAGSAVIIGALILLVPRHAARC